MAPPTGLVPKRNRISASETTLRFFYKTGEILQVYEKASEM